MSGTAFLCPDDNPWDDLVGWRGQGTSPRAARSAAGGPAPSLSLCNISIQEAKPEDKKEAGERGGEGEAEREVKRILERQEAKKVNASALAKKAECLHLNCKGLIDRRGINFCGFVTLTFAENLTDREEAQRRFNSLATNFLREVPDIEYICAVERQGRGAIHFHLVVAFPWDIRTGFDFKSLSEANLATSAGLPDKRREIERASNWFNAPQALRTWWHDLAGAARRYHFGRCETFPLVSNSEAVARYVGAYVGKEFGYRLPEDKGMKTVRYSLLHRVASVRFSWVDGPAKSYRMGCAMLVAFLGRSDFEQLFGKKWNFHLRWVLRLFGSMENAHHLQTHLALIPPDADIHKRLQVVYDLYVSLSDMAVLSGGHAPEKIKKAAMGRCVAISEGRTVNRPKVYSPKVFRHLIRDYESVMAKYSSA